jgi:hypothetical protein
MKLVFKIIIICITIFSLSVFIAKKSIDHTFKQVECNQVDKTPPSKILQRTVEV